MKKDFLSIHDITPYEFHELLDLAGRQEGPGEIPQIAQEQDSGHGL